VLQGKEGIEFYDSTSIAGVDHNQTDDAQYDNIFRVPDYIQAEKTTLNLYKMIRDQNKKSTIIRKIKKIKIGIRKIHR